MPRWKDEVGEEPDKNNTFDKQVLRTMARRQADTKKRNKQTNDHTKHVM